MAKKRPGKARLRVSDHAVVRYLERAGFDDVIGRARRELGEHASDREIVHLIRGCEAGWQAVRIIWQKLGGGLTAEAWRALGDGWFPVEGGGRVRVDEGVVVTYHRGL